MAWMLDAAGGGRSGPQGVVKAQGLAIVWGQVMRVWLNDEDPGHARTMAELDRRLRQAERNLGRLQRISNLVPCRSGRRRSMGEDVAA